ncbi:MAG TPA: choice-of-anchor V domain-containing protein [Candidatus Didemnitutus sp.]|nr:choice-of-anchor V domain-containing protein [Candidatus Didemnitutus sp.]
MYSRQMVTTMMAVALALVSVLTSAPRAVADEGGKNGRTSLTGAGCGDCHGEFATPSTAVTIEGVSGTSISMSPGETRTFTVVVAHTTQAAAGVGIAVKTTTTGTTDAGTLSPVAGSGLAKKGAELTHSAPKTMVAGAATFSFTYTAPMAEGLVYLRAIGNAVDLDGAETSSDVWNWMQPITIDVKATTSVEELGSIVSQKVWPQPLNDATSLCVTGVAPDVYSAVIVNAVGEQLPLGTHQPDGSGMIVFDLSDMQLPKGVYGLILHGSNTTTTSRFVK